MELKITIAFDERTHETLGKLAAALSKEIKVVTAHIVQPETAGEPTHGNAPKTPVTARKVKDDPTPEDKPKSESKAEIPSRGDVWTDNTASVEPVAPEKPAKAITQEELRGLAADVRTKTGSASGIKKVLAEYGATKLSEVPEDKYAEFAKKLEDLL